MEEDWRAFNILTGEPTIKGPLGRPTYRWEDNIRIYIIEIGDNTMNFLYSTQYMYYLQALVNAALNP